MLGVAAVAFAASAPGQTVVVSQFNNAFREDLGLTAAQLGTSYMVGTVAAAVPLVLVGKASDRFGPRAVTAAVCVLFALACAGMGLVNGLVSLTAGFFLLRFLGQGSLSMLSGHALALWYERKLGTMNGIKLMLGQVGFAIVPGVALVLIERFGWRTAYPALGVGVLLMLLPLVIMVSRDHPAQLGQRLDGDPPEDPPGHEHDDEEPEFDPTGHRHVDPAFTLAQTLRTGTFWVLAGAISLGGLIGTALLFHAQPMLEARGLDPAHSAAIARTWSFVIMLSIFPSGWLADRVHARVLVPISLAMLAVATGLQLIGGGLWVMHASLGLFGLGQSLSAGVGVPTIARYFGRAHHGAIRSIVTLIVVAGTGLGPVTLGLSLDHLGSFRPGLIAFVIACVPFLIASGFLTRPASQHHRT